MRDLRLNAELAPIVITGENGSGKTNILEAISFLTPGRGLREAPDCQTSGALRRVWWIANMPRPK
ncbi:MAG: AAA family ATPase [Oscillospiraceae bacterium]